MQPGAEGRSRAVYIDELFAEVDQCIVDGDLDRALDRLWPLGDEAPELLLNQLKLLSGRMRRHHDSVVRGFLTGNQAMADLNVLASDIQHLAGVLRRAALERQASTPLADPTAERLPDVLEQVAALAALDDPMAVPPPPPPPPQPPVVEVQEEELTAVEVEGLRWAVDSKVVLRDIAMAATRGDVVAVVGRNGSGKSSLLRILGLEVAPSAGRVRYPMAQAQGLTEAALRDGVAHLEQRPPSMPGRVGALLTLHTSLRRAPTPELHARMQAMVERMGLTPHWADDWSALSGGFRTRFELVRLLLGDPQLLLLDEPLAALDPPSQAHYIETVRDLARSPRRPAIVITSQHVAEVEAIADMVLVLDAGRVRYWGRPDGIEAVVGRRVFDYRGALGLEELAATLAPLGPFVVRPKGVAIRLVSPDPVDPSSVLRALVEAGPVQHFSDLSGSALLLLDEAES